MDPKIDTEIARWALALLQASHTADAEATAQVLASVGKEYDGPGRLLACLGGLVVAAHGRDPRAEDFLAFLALIRGELDALDGTGPGE